MPPNKSKHIATETCGVCTLSQTAKLVIRDKQPRQRKIWVTLYIEMTKTTFWKGKERTGMIMQECIKLGIAWKEHRSNNSLSYKKQVTSQNTRKKGNFPCMHVCIKCGAHCHRMFTYQKFLCASRTNGRIKEIKEFSHCSYNKNALCRELLQARRVFWTTVSSCLSVSILFLN